MFPTERGLQECKLPLLCLRYAHEVLDFSTLRIFFLFNSLANWLRIANTVGRRGRGVGRRGRGVGYPDLPECQIFALRTQCQNFALEREILFALKEHNFSHSKGPRFRTPRVQLSVRRVQHVTFTISRSEALRFRAHMVQDFALQGSKISHSKGPRLRTQDFALRRFRTPRT